MIRGGRRLKAKSVTWGRVMSSKIRKKCDIVWHENMTPIFKFKFQKCSGGETTCNISKITNAPQAQNFSTFVRHRRIFLTFLWRRRIFFDFFTPQVFALQIEFLLLPYRLNFEFCPTDWISVSWPICRAKTCFFRKFWSMGAQKFFWGAPRSKKNLII